MSYLTWDMSYLTVHLSYLTTDNHTSQQLFDTSQYMFYTSKLMFNDQSNIGLKLNNNNIPLTSTHCTQILLINTLKHTVSWHLGTFWPREGRSQNPTPPKCQPHNLNPTHWWGTTRTDSVTTASESRDPYFHTWMGGWGWGKPQMMQCRVENIPKG